MTSNYDVITTLEIFHFCILDDYEANIAPISTHFFLFSYTFDMLFSFFNNRDVSDHQFCDNGI